MKRVIAIGLVAACLGGLASAQTITLDFEAASLPIHALPWSEQGFTFTELDPSAAVIAVGAKDLQVFADGSGGARVRLTRDGGGPFDAVSVDAVAFSTLFQFWVGTFSIESSNGGVRVLNSGDPGTTVALTGPEWTGITHLDVVYTGDADNGDHDLEVDNFAVQVPPAVPTFGGGHVAVLALSLLAGGLTCLRRTPATVPRPA